MAVAAAPASPSAQQALEEALATLMATGGDDLPSGPPTLSGQQALEDALATLTGADHEDARPEPSPTEAAPPVALPRVQLGFRDGSSTSLDPSSTQSQALEQLAQSLTRRD